jgi:Domain of unknown function (DUF4410)
MTSLPRAVAASIVLVALAGCASTQVEDHQPYQGASLARPDRIIVHDFTSDPAKVPPGSPFATRLAGAVRPTAEQIDIGQKLGAQIAEELVADLQGMGLPAVRADGQAAPQVDDIVLHGYFVSIEEGSAGKRLLVGFGSGEAEMRAAVEGYQATAAGLRLLGSGEVATEGTEMPGVVVPLAVLAATANPIGLVVAGGAKLYGESSGSDTIEGAAKRTSEEIAAQLRKAAETQGWI